MVVSLSKSLDFLIGFIVGYVSDKLRTRWGRRKPFIAICGPIFIVATPTVPDQSSAIFIVTTPTIPGQSSTA